MKDFDDIMVLVGSHGKYQRWILIAVVCPTSLFVAMTMNLLLFQLPVPDHWCHVPGRQNTSFSEDAWINLTIPRENGERSKCQQYRLEKIEDGNISYIIHNDTQACQAGWDHDTSEFVNTMATTNEWFCEHEEYSNHLYALNTAGNSVGSLLLPAFADRFIGRRLIYFVALGLQVIFTFPLVWVSNYGVHLALRFLAGLSTETNYMMPYVIGLEFMAPEKRTMATLMSFFAWTTGMCLTSLIGWLVPYWQYLALISCIPSILGFLYWRFLPESPRWLLSQGRIQECAALLLQVAKVNNKNDVSQTQLQSELTQLWNQQDGEVAFTEAFKYPKLRIRTIILFIIGGSSYMMYGVVFLGVTVLSGNYFFTHFVLSLSELPSNALGWMFTQYLGRRFTCIATCLITGAFCAAATFCLHDKWVMLAIVAFTRLFCTQLIYVIYVQCTEILPTPIRSTGLAWMIVCGFAAMVTTPYTLHSDFGEAFPYWLMMSIMLLCAFLGLFLPETIGLSLPQTFQDAENLNKGRPFMSWINHWNQHKYKAVPSEANNQELYKLSTSGEVGKLPID